MKKLLIAGLLALSLGALNSCNKTMSSDLPLPKDRINAVFVTTENNQLISYNATTGAKNWEVTLKGSAEGTPAFYNKKLYLATDAGYLYSIDVILGKIHWEQFYSLNVITKNALAVADGKIYVASSTLNTYDTTGAASWTYDAGTPATSAPQVEGGKVYCAFNDKVHAVDGNGAMIWSSNSSGPIYSSVRVTNGVVYYGSEDKNIYAINQSDGSPKWNYMTGDKVYSSPMIYGGMCIAGSYDYNVYCIDTTSGLLRWKLTTAERIHSSPNIHTFTNSVLIGSYDFNLYSIDHVSGVTKWKYPAASLVKSSPTVYGNYVYFTSFDRYLYCVDVRDGRTVWKSFLNANSLSSPVVDDIKQGLHPGVSGMSTY
ncbi:MAG: PQQ-binding-like beta-propeller repeat protein [Chitinophagaceae bacterium]|nr:PQQ-binding-like beta-propeller repeat protein [Chitinophagaceae bacterium]